MRVDSNSGLNLTPTTSNRPTEVISSTTRATESSPRVDSSFTPTADLTRLLQSVKELPDVREDVVAEAQQRVQTNELTSQQAAIDTAVALLDSQTLTSNTTS